MCFVAHRKKSTDPASKKHIFFGFDVCLSLLLSLFTLLHHEIQTSKEANRKIRTSLKKQEGEANNFSSHRAVHGYPKLGIALCVFLILTISFLPITMPGLYNTMPVLLLKERRHSGRCVWHIAAKKVKETLGLGKKSQSEKQTRNARRDTTAFPCDSHSLASTQSTPSFIDFACSRPIAATATR